MCCYWLRGYTARLCDTVPRRALLLILRDIPTAYQGIAELSSLLPADMSTSISVATSKKLQNTLAFFSAKLKKRLPGRKMPEDIKPFVRQLLPAHRQKHRSFKPGLTRGYPSVDELLFVVDLITHYLKQRSTEVRGSILEHSITPSSHSLRKQPGTAYV